MRKPLRIINHYSDLFTWNKSDRLWQMPFFAGLSVGIVLYIAALMNRPDLGLVAMIGTTIFLYVPETPIYHKMVLAMCCAFGICASFAFGLLGQIYPSFVPIIVFFVTLISAQVVRYFGIGAPGFFFFAFAAILGSYIPFDTKDYAMAIGLVSMGAMVAVFMVLLYALSVIYIFKSHILKPIPKVGEFGFGVIIVDPMIIAIFVSGAMFLQNFLSLERGYWVGISCAAVMTAVTFKQMWVKQIQRILGTIAGVGLAYWFLHYRFSPIEFALLMMALMFFAELTVVRNYALSMVFLTPYSTYLAEVSSFMNYNPDIIVRARILDIAIGSVIGLIGGAFMHWAFFRRLLERFAHKFFTKWRGAE